MTTLSSTCPSTLRPKACPTAVGFTKLLRFTADTFFAKRHGHRAVVLETVAAVPGMVGTTINHLTCLRRMCDDRAVDTRPALAPRTGTTWG